MNGTGKFLEILNVILIRLQFAVDLGRRTSALGVQLAERQHSSFEEVTILTSQPLAEEFLGLLRIEFLTREVVEGGCITEEPGINDGKPDREGFSEIRLTRVLMLAILKFLDFFGG